jgi:hypothetical protein
MNGPGDSGEDTSVDVDDFDGCLHGVPWSEECFYCTLEEDHLEPTLYNIEDAS